MEKNITSQIALSIEQMLELRILGLDTTDCSLAWCPLYLLTNEPKLIGYYLMNKSMAEYKICDSVWPTYTLEDLMLKLPLPEVRFNELMPDNKKWVASIFIKDNIREGCLISRNNAGASPLEAISGILKMMLKEYPDKIISINTRSSYESDNTLFR